MLLDRGAPDDYDNWSKLGNNGWGWSGLLPYFKKARQRRAYIVRADCCGSRCILYLPSRRWSRTLTSRTISPPMARTPRSRPASQHTCGRASVSDLAGGYSYTVLSHVPENQYKGLLQAGVTPQKEGALKVSGILVRRAAPNPNVPGVRPLLVPQRLHCENRQAVVRS